MEKPPDGGGFGGKKDIGGEIKEIKPGSSPAAIYENG
jgi:hypothetical protein